MFQISFYLIILYFCFYLFHILFMLHFISYFYSLIISTLIFFFLFCWFFSQKCCLASHDASCSTVSHATWWHSNDIMQNHPWCCHMQRGGVYFLSCTICDWLIVLCCVSVTCMLVGKKLKIEKTLLIKANMLDFCVLLKSKFLLNSSLKCREAGFTLMMSSGEQGRVLVHSNTCCTGKVHTSTGFSNCWELQAILKVKVWTHPFVSNRSIQQVYGRLGGGVLFSC